MAVVQNPIIGRSQNKMANVVFSTWKGKNVLRSKPLSVRNPKTIAQVNQRKKIGYLAKLSSILSKTIRHSFRESAVDKTEYNAFVKANYPLVEVLGGNAQFINPNNVIISKGSMPTVIPGILSVSGGSIVEFEIDNVIDGYLLKDSDLVGAVVYDPVTKTFYPAESQEPIGTGSIALNFPGANNLATSSIFLYFTRPSEGKSSNSVNYPI